MTSARCNWCAKFIAHDMPAWSWYRAWSRYTTPEYQIAVRVGLAEPTDSTEPLGWTEPQRLCPSCAENASHWTPCHEGLFAQVTE